MSISELMHGFMFNGVAEKASTSEHAAQDNDHTKAQTLNIEQESGKVAVRRAQDRGRHVFGTACNMEHMRTLSLGFTSVQCTTHGVRIDVQHPRIRAMEGADRLLRRRHRVSHHLQEHGRRG